MLVVQGGCPNVMVVGAPKSLCSFSGCSSSAVSLPKLRQRSPFPLQTSSFSLVSSVSHASSSLLFSADSISRGYAKLTTTSTEKAAGLGLPSAKACNVFWLKTAAKDTFCVPKDPQLLGRIHRVFELMSSGKILDLYASQVSSNALEDVDFTQRDAFESYAVLERDLLAHFSYLTEQFLSSFRPFLEVACIDVNKYFLTHAVVFSRT